MKHFNFKIILDLLSIWFLDSILMKKKTISILILAPFPAACNRPTIDACAHHSIKHLNALTLKRWNLMCFHHLKCC